MPQNYTSRDVSFPAPKGGYADQQYRLQQLLLQMQDDEARRSAAETKAAELKAKLADPIEAMNVEAQKQRFAQRRDITPVRGITAAPAPEATPTSPMNWTGQPGSTFFTPPPQPKVIRGVSRITQGELAKPIPVTTAFGTSTPRMASEPMTTGGMTEPRQGADVANDPNYSADYAMRQNEAALAPSVMAAEAAGKARGEQTVVVQTVDDNGNPITMVVPKTAGASFQKGPSAVTENRLTSAKAVVQTGNDIITALSDPKIAALLGPVMSRYNSVADFVGNPPPEFSRLAGQIESYSLANMGVHGMRANNGAEAIKQTVGMTRHTPASIIATLQGLNGFANHLLENNKRSAIVPATGTTPSGAGSAGQEFDYVPGKGLVPRGGG